METIEENAISKNIEIIIIVTNTFIVPLFHSFVLNTLHKFSFYNYNYITYIVPLGTFIFFLLLGVFDYRGKGIEIFKVCFALIICALGFNWLLSITFNSTILEVYSFMVGL
jgi:hypothetical protein